MPVVHFEDQTIACEQGASLRRVLLDAGLSPHRGIHRLLNCRGMGTCGTCAVEVHGDASGPTFYERVRLWVKGRRGLRLACKVRVIGDVWVSVEKLRPRSRTRASIRALRPVR